MNQHYDIPQIKLRSTFRFTADHLGNLRERPTASTDFLILLYLLYCGMNHPEPAANIDHICERFAHLMHTFTKWERCTWEFTTCDMKKIEEGSWRCLVGGLPLHHRSAAHILQPKEQETRINQEQKDEVETLSAIFAEDLGAAFGHHRSFPKNAM